MTRGYAAVLVLVAVALLPLYLLTMPPTITWWYGAADSGDLALAALDFAIPHPSGYPLYVMLGWLTTRLPFGEPALRLNVLNALLATLTTLLLMVAVQRCAHRVDGQARTGHVAGSVTAIGLGVSGLYWSQAIITEVYILNALLLMLGSIALDRVLSGERGYGWLGLAHGLALAHHLTAAVLLPATLAALVAIGVRPTRHDLARYAMGVAVLLPPYGVLALRAAQGAGAFWGPLDTPSGFWDHIRGAAYQGQLRWNDPLATFAELISGVRLLLGDAPLWLLPAATVGVAWGWRWARGITAFWGVIALAALLFTALYQVPDRAVYLLPAYLGYAVLAAFGVLKALAWCAEQRPHTARLARLGGAATVALLSGVWAARGFIAHDLHGDRTATAFAEAMLQDAPADTTLITARDDVTFSLRYWQRVKRVRADVRIRDLRQPLDAP